MKVLSLLLISLAFSASAFAESTEDKLQAALARAEKAEKEVARLKAAIARPGIALRPLGDGRVLMIAGNVKFTAASQIEAETVLALLNSSLAPEVLTPVPAK